MRRGLLLGAAAVLVAVGGGEAARADHVGLTPVVEGDAGVLYVRDNDAGTRDVEWLCGAETSGTVAVATIAACELRQGEELIDDTGVVLYGNKAVTPRLSTVPHGPYEICWKAWAMPVNGPIVEDVTQPNCEQFS